MLRIQQSLSVFGCQPQFTAERAETAEKINKISAFFRYLEGNQIGVPMRRDVSTDRVLNGEILALQ